MAINWELATPSGILIDQAANAWWSGHVNDVLELDEGGAGVLVATETGGVWAVPTAGMALPLSNSWSMPDVNCLAAGPDGPRHFYAGCNGGIIYETDITAGVPLLTWAPVDSALPSEAGNVNSIAILRGHRRIVAACDGGLYWSEIPEFPPPAPRQPFKWTRAGEDDHGQGGYFSVAVGSLTGRTEEPGEEELSGVSIVAGGNNNAVFLGTWRDVSTLFLKRPTLIAPGGGIGWPEWFDGTGASAVAVCEHFPAHLYASCSYPDGRLKMILHSQDGGKEWELTDFKLIDYPGVTDIRSLVGAQGNKWNNCIGVTPSAPGVVAFGWQAGVCVTPDGGHVWKHIDGYPHISADAHVVRFKPTTPDNKHFLYVGSDNGLCQVDLDDFFAGTLTARSDYNQFLPTHQCYATYVTREFYGTLSIAPSYPVKGWAVSGVQDNGNIYNDLAPGSPWLRLPTTGGSGDGGWTGFVDDGGVIHNTTGDYADSAVRSGAAAVLASNGPVPVTLPPPGEPKGLQSPVGDVVRRPHFKNSSGQLMYAVGGQGSNVYGLFPDRNPQMTYHWELLGALPGGRFVASAASHTGASVFVGATDGHIFVLDSALGTFLDLPVVLPQPSPSKPQSGGAATRIVTLSETDAFAMLNTTNLGNFYVLRLDGLNWKPPLSAGLPANTGFYGIDGAIQEQGRPLLFVSTDNRVYMSEDGGENWVPAIAGLPECPHCAELRVHIDGENSWLYLSTFGRSLWRAHIYRVHFG